MPVIRYSASWAVVITTIYYIFQWRKIPFNEFFKTYPALIISFLLVMCVYSYIIPVQYFTYDFGVLNGFVVQLFLLLCIVYVMPFLKEGIPENTFDRVSVLVIVVFCVQSVIQLLGLFNSSIGEFLIDLKPESLFESVNNLGQGFRIFSLSGSPFFELPAGYGVAFILFFRLQFSNYSSWFVSGFRNYIVFILLVVGAMLSGRTGFIGLLCALGMSLFLQKPGYSKLFSGIRSVAAIGIIILSFMMLLPSKYVRMIEVDIMPFAFEFVYTYIDEKEISTVSTDYLSESMYFPLSMKTLAKGDGRYTGSSGMYYRETDAGYMRQILFGGIPFLLFSIIYQMCFFYAPMKIAWRDRHQYNLNDFWCWFTLLLHIFILNYKGEALGRMQIMQSLLLLLGSAYITEKMYSPQYKEE